MGSIAGAARRFAAAASALHSASASAAGFSPAPTLETAVVVAHSSSGRADEHLGIDRALDADKSSPHLYFDKFDRDNLIEHLIDVAGMLASHGAAAAAVAGDPVDWLSC